MVSSAHPQNGGEGDLVLQRKQEKRRNAIERAPGLHVTAVRGDRWRVDVSADSGPQARLIKKIKCLK